MIARAWGRLRRLMDGIRLRCASGDHLRLGSRIVMYGFPSLNLHPDSRVEIGDDVILCSRSQDTALALNHPVKLSTIAAGASLTIGRDSGISGATIVCAKSIRIGVEVLLGANVVIVDTDFHPIVPQNRRHSDDASRIGVAPVEIGDNVFVGMEAVVLKGVRIGRDSVVAARAVVTRGDYPDGAILAGHPAAVIGSVYDRDGA
jgi:acetyltransferase-like isoleucine patch superfamily enzyme